MIETVFVDSMEKVMDMISYQEWNEDIARMRGSFFFRGMPDARFNLTTSLRMNCKHLHRQLEPAVLRNFTKYASIEDPTLSGSVWKQMMIGQHHGLPTRLLDWTRSPLTALHFANTEGNLNKLSRRDAVVWRFDMRDSNKNLPEKYKSALRDADAFVFSVDQLTCLVDSLEQYDEDMGESSLVNIEPPSVDQRIINQYSFFSIIPAQMENIEEYLEKYTTKTVRYIINKEIRWDIRDMLDRFNINERILYPGLDGLSRSLARHYFVK